MSPSAQTTARIFSFVSCKGGVGTTFLTVQLGSILASRARLRVLVVDLVHPFGDAILMLSQSLPPATVCHLASHPGRLDETLLQSALVFPQPRLGLLAASNDSQDPAKISAEFIGTLLTVASACFDCILLDCGRGHDPKFATAFERAHRVLLVLRATLPMVRDGRRLAGVLASLGLEAEKLLPVINTVRRDSAIQPRDIEAALQLGIPRLIPEDAAFTQHCIDTGLPVTASDARHPISQSLLSLAAHLVPGNDSLKPAAGLLRRWLDRPRLRNDHSDAPSDTLPQPDRT